MKLDRRQRWLAGALSVSSFVASFETTAVQTITPQILDEIGGRSLYAMVFGVFTVAELVGLVFGGWLETRRGVVPAFVLGVLLHATGLLVCGTAPTFGSFLVGRAAQGIGTGIVVVSVYVIIATSYPDSQRGRVLGFIVASWATPGFLGPLIAGTLTSLVSWRVVLWPVGLVDLALLVVIWPVMREVKNASGTSPRPKPSLVSLLGPALLLSAGVAGLLLLDELPRSASWPLLIVAGVAIGLGAIKLLPRGAWRLAPGLPAAVLLRGLIGAPWYGVAFLLPLALVEARGFRLAEAGLALSAGILGYATTGLLFGSSRLAKTSRLLLIRVGTLAQCAGLAVTAAGVDPRSPVALVYIGWSITGLGTCLAVNSLNVVVLRLSEESERGTSTSAMAMAELVTVSILTAVAGLALAGATTGAAVVMPAQITMGVSALGLLLLLATVGRLRATKAEHGNIR